ncbi:protein starmaker-like [Senna tora]|uniref:Protein starmaker-like n=1 Tax=Senna tora TaxID=362788 RepID=A0A834X8Z5_9FABA|nr:protein starmaker-like [Senna tora]
MPSGAKKRKAAKKKKGKEANTNPSASNPQGNDDLKYQDEKGSDGGEVEGGSPAYHDHDDHHHPFNEGSEEVEEGDPSAAQSSVSDVKSVEEVPADITGAEAVEEQEDIVVQIERDLKSEDISETKIDNIEHIESVEESHYGNGNSGGTSNVESATQSVSDVKLIEEVPGDITGAEAVDRQEDDVVKIERDLKSEDISDRTTDSIEHIESVEESRYGNGNSGGTSNVESATQSSVSDVKSIEVPDDITGAEVVEGQEDDVVKIERDLKSEDVSNRTIDSIKHIESVEESCYGNGNSGGTSNVESHNEHNSKDEPCDSKQEAIPSEDLMDSVHASLTKMSSTTEKAPVEETGNLIVEPSVNSVKAVASMGEVKNSDDGSALLEKSVVSQVAETDLAMKKNEDKVFPLPDQHVRAPNSEEPEQKEYDNKVSTSLSESPAAESTKDAVHVKNSDRPECSENQVKNLLSEMSLLTRSSRGMSQNAFITDSFVVSDTTTIESSFPICCLGSCQLSSGFVQYLLSKESDEGKESDLMGYACEDFRRIL